MDWTNRDSRATFVSSPTMGQQKYDLVAAELTYDLLNNDEKRKILERNLEVPEEAIELQLIHKATSSAPGVLLLVVWTDNTKFDMAPMVEKFKSLYAPIFDHFIVHIRLKWVDLPDSHASNWGSFASRLSTDGTGSVGPTN